MLTSRPSQLRRDSSRSAMPKPNSRPTPLLLEADSLESLDVQSTVIPVGDGSMEPYQPDTADSEHSADSPAGSGYVTPNLFGSHEESELFKAHHGLNGQQSQPEVPPPIQLALHELQQQQEALMALDGMEGDNADDSAQTPEPVQHSKPRWADIMSDDDEGAAVEDLWPMVPSASSSASSAASTAASSAASSASSGASIANAKVPGFRQGMEVHRGMWH